MYRNVDSELAALLEPVVLFFPTTTQTKAPLRQRAPVVKARSEVVSIGQGGPSAWDDEAVVMTRIHTFQATLLLKRYLINIFTCQRPLS